MNRSLSIGIGTASGTLLSLVPNLFSEDVIRTVILAAVGAVVSFVITLLLKWLSRSKKQ